MGLSETESWGGTGAETFDKGEDKGGEAGEGYEFSMDIKSREGRGGEVGVGGRG